MSVDKFGDCDISSSGPIGPAGKDGFDIVKWLPKFILNQFRKSEELCCLLINDPEKDLVKRDGNYIKWISQCDIKLNAKAVKPSKSIKLIKNGHWCLNFNKSLYSITEISVSDSDCVFACVTFHLDEENEQFIFSDYDADNELSRGVSATKTAIIIYGVDNENNYISIPYQTSTWTTVLVEWLPHKRLGMYTINDKSGTFTSNTPSMFLDDDVYLGARKGGAKPLLGSISAFEVYRSVEKAPTSIKDLVLRGQMNISLAASLG